MTIRDFLDSQKVVILDGAMGTELQRRGFETSLPLWSAPANEEAADLVKAIHKDYITAGADIIVTNTFSTQRYSFGKVDEPERAEAAIVNAAQAALAAKDEADRPVFVGGGLAPLEDCYEPENVPEDDQLLYDEHLFQAQILADQGVDFIFAETANCIREAKVMAQVAQGVGKPLMISFVCNPEGNLLSGEAMRDAVEMLKEFNPLAILVNCRPIEVIGAAVDRLLESYDGVTGMYANGTGSPADDLGWKFDQEVASGTYADFGKECVSKGMKIIGGCCGTSPEYIEELQKNLT